jgi:hypothetical protein
MLCQNNAAIAERQMRSHSTQTSAVLADQHCYLWYYYEMILSPN